MTHADDPASDEPTDADIESWMAAERQRREDWLSGPSEAEKAAWARREYERRRRRTGLAWPRPTGDASRALQRYVREMQLATEGALSLLFNMSMSEAFDRLVRAGREWEDEVTTQPARRRRAALDADAERGTPADPKRVPHPPEGTVASG